MAIDFARRERAELCELFLDVGPDAPTLCEGWTTRDLAAHLVVRERRPDAAIGIVVPALAGHGDSVRGRYATRSYDELVGLVHDGPPRWNPMRLDALDRATNTVEYFIHHEDVRRAADGWEPRELDPALADQLWAMVTRMTRLTMRRAPAGVVFVEPDRGRHLAKDGTPVVEVTGPAPEIALFVSGRQGHSRVELTGADDAVQAVRTASFGV
jgi:uncharacterized protein (TIGR03085 family)